MSNLIEKSVREFIQAGSCMKQPIDSEQDILGTGVLDSLGIANLLAFVETEFGLNVPLEDVTVENFSTTKGIAEFVSSRLNAQ